MLMVKKQPIIPLTRGDVRPVNLERLPSMQMDAAPAALFAREDFAREIGRVWRESQERFVLIGRYLNEAKARLPHGEFMAMVAADLPFKHSTANKLMIVARFVDGRAIDPALLPPSSETCYQITTLSELERQQAVTEGIIRPEMRREDVVQFKRRLRAPVMTDRRTELEAEERRLLERLEAVRRELRSLR